MPPWEAWFALPPTIPLQGHIFSATCPSTLPLTSIPLQCVPCLPFCGQPHYLLHTSVFFALPPPRYTSPAVAAGASQCVRVLLLRPTTCRPHYLVLTPAHPELQQTLAGWRGGRFVRAARTYHAHRPRAGACVVDQTRHAWARPGGTMATRRARDMPSTRTR